MSLLYSSLRGQPRIGVDINFFSLAFFFFFPLTNPRRCPASRTYVLAADALGEDGVYHACVWAARAREPDMELFPESACWRGSTVRDLRSCFEDTYQHYDDASHPLEETSRQVERILGNAQSLPKKKSESKVVSSQLSVAGMFKPKLQSSSIKAQEITKKTAGFIAHSLQQYSVVEEESFEMMRCAIREYVVPLQNTFSQTVILNLYATKKNELKECVGDVFENGGAECFTLTTDGCTSRAGDSYVCVTAHMMDRNFTQHAYALACKAMKQEHSGENIPYLLA